MESYKKGEWEFSEKIELDYEVNPGNNISPKEKTAAYITYTDTHLYLAIHALSDPKKFGLQCVLVMILDL